MTNSDLLDYWRKCTTCKKLIGFGQKYWICSVSTCNRTRTDLVFCDLRCFDAHVPVMNHRDAGAFEKTSPTKVQIQKERALSSEKESADQSKTLTIDADEILVVVSKVKNYIRTTSGMNTSDSIMRVLSDSIRKDTEVAIENAKKSGRKTLLDRDFR